MSSLECVMRRCLALLVLPLVACTDSAPRNSRALVRDSAGIRIVENTTPQWQDGEEWYLRPEPVVEIGDADGPEYELFRVGNAFLLDDGRIGIVNRGTNEIRIFDERGKYLLAIGRTGSGPGEFERLMWAGRFRGDSLAAYQFFPPTFTVFDKQGKYQRTTSVNLSNSRPLGIADDGSLFAIKGAVTRFARPEGVVRDSLILLRAVPQQPLWDSIGTYSGNEMLYQRAGNSFRVTLPLFPRQTDIFVQGDRFYVAENHAYNIRKYRLDGQLEMIVRRNVQPVPVREEHVRALLTIALERESDPETRRVQERALRETLPQTLPTLGPRSTEWGPPVTSAIRIDAIGNLWVLEYRVPGSDRLPRWSVFDSGGILLGDVEYPVGFVPLDIGRDYVLGMWRDADDVEHVQLYDLIKPEQ